MIISMGFHFEGFINYAASFANINHSLDYTKNMCRFYGDIVTLKMKFINSMN